MRKFLDHLYLASAAIGASCIALIAVLMVGQSVLREFGVRTGATNDIVSWLCAAASFFAMAHAFKNGDFVRVTLFIERLKPAPRRALETVCLGVGSAATGYLAYWACRFTFESYEFNDLAQGLLAMPLWIPQLSFAFGACLLCTAMLDELLLVISGQEPTFVRLTRERHAKGDFSADV